MGVNEVGALFVYEAPHSLVVGGLCSFGSGLDVNINSCVCCLRGDLTVYI
jgi:hypothetical protein